MSLLSLRGLSKSYGTVRANRDIDLDVAEGSIHAILGENGAGKSTLMKLIYGVESPDEGEIFWQGDKVSLSSPAEARSRGIGMVFQHFSLFETLTVVENISLIVPGRKAELTSRIRELGRDYGLEVDPAAHVHALSVGERQRVEIIRCLLQDPKLLIMDEPTSVLTPQEVEILFQTLRKLSSEGTAILYISHKLEEIRALCDNATILRLGKNVGSCIPRDTTARDMAEMMVGTALQTPERSGRALGEVALDIKGLSAASPSAFGTSLKDVSLSVRKGEIVGIGGVAGNGQDELLAALSGEILSAPGAVSLHGRPVGGLGPSQRRKLGLLTGPEERLGHAAAPDMSLTENAMLTGALREGLVSNGFLKWGAARDFAQRIIQAFDVRTPGPENAARSLSGGNLQKFVIGREVLQRPEVLVVNQPTWGVDAAAAAAIRQALLDLAAGGTALVVISQDLDELMEIADNFAALNEGRLTAPRPTAGLTIDEIGLMMGGAHGMEVAHV